MRRRFNAFFWGTYQLLQSQTNTYFCMGDITTLNNTSVIVNCDCSLAVEVAWSVQHDSSLLEETIHVCRPDAWSITQTAKTV